MYSNSKEIFEIQKERSHCSKLLITYLWIVAYLMGKTFTLYTDHEALTRLMNMEIKTSDS